MGRFLQEKEPERNLINQYVDNYLDATNRYAKWTQGAPTFVTYYSLKLNSSTSDHGLNNVMEVVGNESPIKYNKIESFPIYLEGEVNFTFELDEESGFDGESEGNAIILPGTVVPQNDDLIVFEVLERKYVYRVSNVESSSTSMRAFYRVTFFVTSFDINTLDERQVETKYSTIYDNIGTELNPIIPEFEFTLLDDIQEVIKYLSERYIRLYYDEKVNSFIYNKDRMNMVIYDFYKNSGVYDPKLALFIKRNNLFINKKTFLKNIYIECLLENRDLDYEKSIYSFLETGNINEFEYPYFFFNKIYESAFMLFQDKYHELVHNPTDIYDDFLCCSPEYQIKKGQFTSINLKEYIKNEKLLIDDLPIKEQILIIYLRILQLKEQNNITDSYEDIVALSKKVKVDKDFYSYLQIPCVIFILKSISDKITHKTNYIK